jgi:hypothetical protein
MEAGMPARKCGSGASDVSIGAGGCAKGAASKRPNWLEYWASNGLIFDRGQAGVALVVMNVLCRV